jgi:hypothetical protein
MMPLCMLRRSSSNIEFVEDLWCEQTSFQFLLGQRYLNDRQQKWVSKLQAYDFDIFDVKGEKNVVADALSSMPTLESSKA